MFTVITNHGYNEPLFAGHIEFVITKFDCTIIGFINWFLYVSQHNKFGGNPINNLVFNSLTVNFFNIDHNTVVEFKTNLALFL